jgi:hypothetical protein
VVLLGVPELRRRRDLDDDLLLQLRFDGALRLLGGLLLRVVEVEDGRAVLMAAIAELPLGGERVDVVPVQVEQLGVARLGRIIEDVHGLGVPGGARAHLLVADVLLAAAVEAADHRLDARLPLERRLHAPEAAAGEDRLALFRGARGRREKNERAHEWQNERSHFSPKTERAHFSRENERSHFKSSCFSATPSMQ